VYTAGGEAALLACTGRHRSRKRSLSGMTNFTQIGLDTRITPTEIVT